jgi:hypothetical protein
MRVGIAAVAGTAHQLPADYFGDTCERRDVSCRGHRSRNNRQIISTFFRLFARRLNRQADSLAEVYGFPNH